MNFLADENVRKDVVNALRRAGNDVHWIQEESPGIDDTDVLARAVAENRVLITFDKGDFGALVFRDGQPAHGIILFRVTAASPTELVTKIVNTVQSRDDWPGYFWTITNRSIRRRKLP